MTPEQRYQQLKTRQSDLKTRLAVMTSQEEEKKKERETLEDQLQQGGVNITKLDEEKARLETEITQLLDQADKDLTEFEKQLNQSAVTGPAKATPPQSPTEEIPVDKDIDI